MKNILLLSVVILTCSLVSAQTNEKVATAPNRQNLYSANNSAEQNTVLRNYLAAYVGIFELNVNYERTIFDLPRSYINLRLGLGTWVDQPTSDADGGPYINPCFVLVTGQKSSHFEFDFGLIAFFKNTPEIFVEYPFSFSLGYRYEPRDLKGVLRVAVGFPGLLNLGYGFKF